MRALKNTSIELDTVSEAATITLGKTIARSLSRGSVVALEGALGTGKTTLTKGIVKGLFPRKAIKVKSPSFAIVNQYEGTFPLYHIDCYRIDDINELTHIGIEEFIFSRGISIIEWAEKIKTLLPDTTLFITITDCGEQKRKFVFYSPQVCHIKKLRRLLYV